MTEGAGKSSGEFWVVWEPWHGTAGTEGCFHKEEATAQVLAHQLVQRPVALTWKSPGRDSGEEAGKAGLRAPTECLPAY